MQIELTSEAEELLRKKGGTLTVDYIRPTGWGKVAEVSVDTNVKGKNLAPYRRVTTAPDLKVLVTPKLVGLASLMVVTTKGGFRKKLTVQLSDGSDGACEIWATPAHRHYRVRTPHEEGSCQG